MLRTVVFASVIALAAGSASAVVSVSAPASTGAKDPSFTMLPQIVSRGALGTVVAFPVAGIQSLDAFGTPGNTVVAFDLAAAAGLASGTPVTMTGVGWDVTLTAAGATGQSWLSELRVYFDDNIAPDGLGLFLRPGAGTNLPGTASFASGGILDLSDAGLANIPMPDGVARLDFHESFDDVAGAVDGTWDAGFLFIAIAEVPTPGAAALMGLAGLAGLRRRR